MSDSPLVLKISLVPFVENLGRSSVGVVATGDSRALVLVLAESVGRLLGQASDGRAPDDLFVYVDPLPIGSNTVVSVFPAIAGRRTFKDARDSYVPSGPPSLRVGLPDDDSTR